METQFDRRRFVQLLGAVSADLGLQGGSAQPAAAQTAPAKVPARPAVNATKTINRKNVVAIQVKPFCWTDEGIDKVLDTIQEKGNVNTVFAYTYDYDESHITKGGSKPLPDHGKYSTSGPRQGGAFYDYDLKYFRDTTLTDFRSHDEPNFNVITAVGPKMHARGMQFFAWDYNNAFPVMMRNIPGLTEVAEIDVYGRRTSSACFNHPNYRAHLTGKIESYLAQYPTEVDGVIWGCERMGPIDNLIGGGWATVGICCFCSFCCAKAQARGVSVARAKEGYIKLDQLFHAAAQSQRPSDGYFVTFMRTLFQFPEILSWNMLWHDSYHEVRAELYGTAKAIAPTKPFGFHVVQNTTFSPFYSAADDYMKLATCTDFLKIATYNNAAGPRLAGFIKRLCATVFADANPSDLQPFYYKMMGYSEASFDEIVTKGLSAEYVASETKRAITGTGGKVQIYPGIDIDVPTSPGEKHTTPDDVRASTKAAFAAGAHGVVLSREYYEMWLANLSAAGETTRQIFGAAASNAPMSATGVQPS
jgi:hypothetical protein